MSRARIVLAIVVVVSVLVTSGAPAATSPVGRVAPGHPVRWTGGPLRGASGVASLGPFGTQPQCVAGLSCDEFALEVAVPKSSKVFALDVSVQVDAPNAVAVELFAPGATVPIGSGPAARAISPKSGQWKVRVRCASCADATYRATATLSVVPAPGGSRGAFRWDERAMPGGTIGEPGVADDSAGRIYVVAPANGVTVWASADNGRSWTTHPNVEAVPPGQSQDGDLAVAPDDGTVYVANLSSELTPFVYTSTDHGATYSTPVAAGADADRPWLAAAPGGVVYLVYHELVNAMTQLWVYRSGDHAKTFTKISNVNLAQGSWLGTGCTVHMDRPHIDPRDPNTMYIFYTTDQFSDCTLNNSPSNDYPMRELWVAKSTDGGATFTNALVYGSTHRLGHLLPAAAVDRAGNVYVTVSESGEALSGQINPTTRIVMLSSTDGAKTWRGPFRVDRLADHTSNVMPAIAAGPPGFVDLLWYSSRAPSFGDWTGLWTVQFAQSVDAASRRPKFVQSRASKGYVHAADACQSGVGCLAGGGNRNLLDFLSIAMDRRGSALCAWADDSTGPVRTMFGRQIAGPRRS